MFDNLIFSDSRVREEFLDRFDELAYEARGGGLEGLDSLSYSVDDAHRAINGFQERRDDFVQPGLEAIIRRFGRPAYFIQNDDINTSEAASSSKEVDAIVKAARGALLPSMPSVGRINLRNHDKKWIGTGWLVADGVMITNRHVAMEFASGAGSQCAFLKTAPGQVAEAYFDPTSEHCVARQIEFRIGAPLWISPVTEPYDVAFLSVEAMATDGKNASHAPIHLMCAKDYGSLCDGRWLAVVGYPAFSDSYAAVDQHRIFQHVYDVKRLQPGKLVGTPEFDRMRHDATTLGGNSGSVVLDLTSGYAVGLHFGGKPGCFNLSVPAPIVKRLLHQHVLNRIEDQQ
ncbi:serine protease [Stieleria sp. JC731]|uniref:trypsin-like serine peptidase n=1 Tax=Pirellulaceae TaxID=2691357 RepID=UPI001E404694|nr:serine protease [Stieleria sp. JC731]MCC9601917.1 serine protease [Stieleria sp. JC731]